MPNSEHAKIYTLTDGSKWTARQVAIKLDINQSTMYARLQKGMRDVKELAKKPSQGCRRTHAGYSPPKLSKAVEIDIKTRNAYCPISRLFMTMA